MKLDHSKLNSLYKLSYNAIVRRCPSIRALVNYLLQSAGVGARRGHAYSDRYAYSYRRINGETGSRKVNSYTNDQTNWINGVGMGVVGNSFSNCDVIKKRGNRRSRNSLIQGNVLSNTIESMYGSINHLIGYVYFIGYRSSF